MIWLVLIAGAIIIVVFMNRFINSSSLALARKQMAAEDPEGYRLVQEYEESQKPENKARAAALLAEQRREAKGLLTSTLTPVDDVPILLRSGEKAYWCEHCRYYEERSLRDLGMDRGMREVDAGSLVLTDKRIVFLGAKQTIDIPFSKIVAIQQRDGSMNVSVANGKTRLLETGNPRAEVIAARLVSKSDLSTSDDGALSQIPDNIFTMNLDMSFAGPQEQIRQTLDGVADLLQKEVDKHAEERAFTYAGKPLDAPTYLSIVSGQSQALADISRRAEATFAAASGPNGSPDLLRRAYGDLLDRLLTVRRTLRENDAPPKFVRTESEYQSYVDTLYDELAQWPQQVGSAARNISGDQCDLRLSASCDVASLQKAIAAETR
jgi:hypothetical protein